MAENYPTFTGKKRASTLYGMSESKLKELRRIGSDPDAKLRGHFQSLFQFTSHAVSHARELAKTDHKDEARTWFRFLSNSKVSTILRDVGYDVTLLDESLNMLGLECHPLDVPSFTNDLAAIKYCLNEILTNVLKKSRTTKTVSQIDRRWLGSGEPEHLRDLTKNVARLERAPK